MFCRLVQNRLLVFVHCNELDINPSTYPHWERVKSNPNQETLLSLLFCTNQVICFCTIFSFKISPSLLPTEKRILLPHFEKKLFLLTYTQWERSFFKSVYKSLYHCTNPTTCFCAVSNLKRVFHLYCEKYSKN